MKETTDLKKLEKFGLGMIFDLIPGGVCVATDNSCKEIIHNPVAARFLRTQPWMSLSTEEKVSSSYRMFRRGKEISLADQPLQRAAWFGDELAGDELELVWEDGVRKYALWSSRPLRDTGGNIIAAVCTFEDITQMKQKVAGIERHNDRQRDDAISDCISQLWDKQAQFCECLDNILACFSILEAVRDKTGKITDFVIKYVNEAACRHYKKPAKELAGRKLIETYPGMAKEIFPDLCRVVETEQANKNDNRNYKDPTNTHLTGTYAVRHVKLGDGLVACWRNITEKKRIEQELNIRTEQYRTVVENLTDLVCRSLPDTTVTFVNDAYCKFFGRTPKEVIGKRWLEFALPADRPALQQYWNGLCSNPTGKDEKKLGQMVGADGNSYWFEWINRPMVDAEGNVVEIQGVGRNRTIEKQLEEELRSSEKKYRELLDSIPCLVLWSNKAGIVGFVNDFANKFFGSSLGNLLDIPILGLVMPDAGRNSKSLWRMAADERPIVSEYRLSNGRQVWIQWTFRKYAYPVSQEPGVLCVGIDITDQRHAEQALLQEYERRYITDLFNKALRGEIGGQELVEIAQRSGIFFAAKSLLHIIQIDGVVDGRQVLVQDKHNIQYRVDRLIAEFSFKTAGAAWQSAAGVAVLIPFLHMENQPHSNQYRDVADMLFSLTRTAFPDKEAYIGVASVTGNPPDLVLTYQQAMFALRAGRASEQGKTVYYWQDLGILQLMSVCCDSELSLTFIQSELGNLLKHDKLKADTLIDTLEAILTSDSVSSITKRLHIHEKTVLFRKRKIERILGTNIDHHDKRLSLLMAIKLLRLRAGKNR